jgi:hypothetical protein
MELEAALDVDPSPEFAARVRTAVDRRPRKFWSWPRAAVILGGCAAIGVLAVRVRPEAPAQPTLPTIAQERLPETTGSEGRGSEVATAASEGHATRAGQSVRRRNPPADPAVLVSVDQLLALRQFAAGLRDGRLDAGNLPSSLVVPEQRAPDSGSSPGSELIRKIALETINADDL